MSITSANAVITIAIPGLYDAPVTLEQFSADDIFDVDPNELAEARMGVDGVLTGGRVNAPLMQKISFMADSPSVRVFDTWNAAQRQINDLYFAHGGVTLRSTGMKYTLVKGIFRSWQTIPSARKVLETRVAELVWQSIDPAPLGA